MKNNDWNLWMGTLKGGIDRSILLRALTALHLNKILGRTLRAVMTMLGRGVIIHVQGYAGPHPQGSSAFSLDQPCSYCKCTVCHTCTLALLKLTSWRSAIHRWMFLRGIPKWCIAGTCHRCCLITLSYSWPLWSRQTPDMGSRLPGGRLSDTFAVTVFAKLEDSTMRRLCSA